MKLTNDELKVMSKVLKEYGKVLSEKGLNNLSDEDAKLYQDILLLLGNIYMHQNGIQVRS